MKVAKTDIFFETTSCSIFADGAYDVKKKRQGFFVQEEEKKKTGNASMTSQKKCSSSRVYAISFFSYTRFFQTTTCVRRRSWVVITIYPHSFGYVSIEAASKGNVKELMPKKDRTNKGH